MVDAKSRSFPVWGAILAAIAALALLGFIFVSQNSGQADPAGENDDGVTPGQPLGVDDDLTLRTHYATQRELLTC